MCGIVGYVGNKDASEVLISGLSRLEYRGYDSAGISVLHNGELTVKKAAGRLKNLEEKLQEEKVQGHMGIGHTRWATHGAPLDKNSHPHNSNNGKISVVHNGIIENYMEVKERLQGLGYIFYSDTDTEVIPNLVDYYYSGNLLEAVKKAAADLKGSYALGVMALNEPDKIVATRKDSPLVVGVGDKEFFIASDVPAVLNYTKSFVYLNDGEFAELCRDSLQFFNQDGEQIEREITEITWSAESAEKGGYAHFTIKEIYEQPKALKDTMTGRIVPGKKIKLDDIHITKEMLEDYSRIYIIACGTAYNAGLIGKVAIENLARIPVEVDVASEFRYRNPIIDAKTLVIVISQSGETADTLAVSREAQKFGARVIAITNVVGSSIAREADDVFYTWAGPEIGVASTKAYLTMLVAIYSIGIYFAELLGTQQESYLEDLKKELLTLPEKVASILADTKRIEHFADKIHTEKDVFFLGRGLDYQIAVEASLKLKELSYIHSEAYPGGELKHGSIALIEDDITVIASLTQRDLLEKMQSNIKEVVSRGAKVMAITFEDNHDVEHFSDEVIIIPNTMDLIAPILAVVPLQLLAYYVALYKGLDVDKPRNLAKSVTVE